MENIELCQIQLCPIIAKIYPTLTSVVYPGKAGHKCELKVECSATPSGMVIHAQYPQPPVVASGGIYWLDSRSRHKPSQNQTSKFKPGMFQV